MGDAAAALRAAHSAMSHVLSANRATIDMPRAYWDELFDALQKVSDALREPPGDPVLAPADPPPEPLSPGMAK
jgi:hypothetical protein